MSKKKRKSKKQLVGLTYPHLIVVEEKYLKEITDTTESINPNKREVEQYEKK